MKTSSKRISLLIPTFMFLLVLFIFGCDSDPGPDAISSRGPFEPSGTLSDCSGCHFIPLGTRRAVMGSGGDFGANLAITSYHVTGATDPSSGQCLVCHDLSTHGAGTVRLWNADTGASIAYNPFVPSSIEPFCLSCHDVDGATTTFIAGGSALNPFNDGSTLGSPPYPYATRIAASWAKSYGHGPNGNHAPADIVTCLGTGQPGTGCHGNGGTLNAHGSVYEVLSTREFQYDIPDEFFESFYDLCFNCHSFYPGFTKEDTLGVLAGGILDWIYGSPVPTGGLPPYYTGGVTTHFADHNEGNPPYDDPNFFGENMNLHWFHLGIQISYVRGDTAIVGGVICVNCHDVHGSNTQYGATYDEIGYTNIFPDATNILGKMSDAAYGGGFLNPFPTYCSTFNCHGGFMGITRAWYEPIVE